MWRLLGCHPYAYVLTIVGLTDVTPAQNLRMLLSQLATRHNFRACAYDEASSLVRCGGIFVTNSLAAPSASPCRAADDFAHDTTRAARVYVMENHALCRDRQSETRKTRRDGMGRDRTRPDQARQDETATRQSSAWHGMSWRGTSWPGTA